MSVARVSRKMDYLAFKRIRKHFLWGNMDCSSNEGQKVKHSSIKSNTRRYKRMLCREVFRTSLARRKTPCPARCRKTSRRSLARCLKMLRMCNRHRRSDLVPFKPLLNNKDCLRSSLAARCLVLPYKQSSLRQYLSQLWTPRKAWFP